jgi:cyclophilin family peptidyl-prolyl cis-trans isomerase
MVTLALLAALAPQVSGLNKPADFKPTGPKLVVTMSNGKSFTITTNKSESPITVGHIVKLVESKFYDRQRVHRVENWVTQWGAPASKTKDITTEEVLGGGSGKDIKFEKSKWDFHRGVVGIASTGLQVGGDSQIFILKGDAFRLYGSYAVLGKVTAGMATVDGIKKGDRIRSIRVVRR